MRTRAALCVGLILALFAVVVPSAAAAGRDPGPTAAVLLELDTEPAAPAWQRAASEARRAQRSRDGVRREAALAGAEQRVRAVWALDRLAGSVRSVVPGSRTLYRMQTLLTGLAVRVPVTELPGLAGLPGVRAVRPITLKDRSNAHSVPLTGAPEVWAGPNTGEGVRIGIIDSGIDYTHADFGGPGTEQAFHSVDRTKPAPAGLFPNEKVIGGKDLVGDDYNPDPASPHHQPVPHPGPNPIDCDLNGHGTHVAGTAAGYGVTADGRTYHGPYRPGLDPAGFKVGPGAAPGAKLYAIRVFGCEGSTDQLAHALDVAAVPGLPPMAYASPSLPAADTTTVPSSASRSAASRGYRAGHREAACVRRCRPRAGPDHRHRAGRSRPQLPGRTQRPTPADALVR